MNAVAHRSEQNGSLHLNWARHDAIVNSAHAHSAQYGVDGGWQRLKTSLYLEKEGVLALIACLASV